jgi:hypothetical protein
MQKISKKHNKTRRGHGRGRGRGRRRRLTERRGGAGAEPGLLPKRRNIGIYKLTYVNSGGDLPDVILSQKPAMEGDNEKYGLHASNKHQKVYINRGFNQKAIDNFFRYPHIKKYNTTSKVFVLKSDT